jgi:hypothetical protein
MQSILHSVAAASDDHLAAYSLIAACVVLMVIRILTR